YPIHHTTFFCFRKNRATSGLDHCGAVFTIITHSSHDDSKYPRVEHLCRRTKKNVDGWTMKHVKWSSVQMSHAVSAFACHRQVAARRGKQDHAGLQDVALLRLAYLKRREFIQAICIHLGISHRHVQHDRNGYDKIRG